MRCQPLDPKQTAGCYSQICLVPNYLLHYNTYTKVIIYSVLILHYQILINQLLLTISYHHWSLLQTDVPDVVLTGELTAHLVACCIITLLVVIMFFFKLRLPVFFIPLLQVVFVSMVVILVAIVLSYCIVHLCYSGTPVYPSIM